MVCTLCPLGYIQLAVPLQSNEIQAWLLVVHEEAIKIELL